MGVLKQFLKQLPADEVAYDVVTGVSVGAINALHLAYHEKGDEQAAVASLGSVILKT